jgi:two-component system sensor histidine kinase/response regulator
MDNNQSLNKYIKRGAVIIYAITTFMGCLGYILDIISLHELSKYIVINNLITIGIFIISVLLYLFRVLRMPVSFAIIIYTVLLNIIIDFVTKPYGNQQVLFFMRNSFVIIYLITLSSLIINKKHGIIITLIYLASFISLTLISKDKFLLDTILMQLSLLTAYTYVIYYFVSAFEKSINQQMVNSNIIREQNEVVHEANILLKEKQLKVEEQAKELEKINNQLKETVATKDKFFSIIAHDLKNPLGGLMEISNLLYNEYSQYDDEQKNKIVKAIYESSKNTYNLLDNLLTWSRMQTNGIKYNPEIINLYDLIYETSHILENMCSGKNIDLNLSMDKSTEIYADKYMLSSVVNNLLSNAIKFTPVGGTVNISAELTGNGYIRICVSDNGTGISQDGISRLFRIDQNYSTKGTNNEEGTGLGLLLCKEFVERNGGTIWVESELNRGSHFFFTVRTK